MLVLFTVCSGMLLLNSSLLSPVCVSVYVKICLFVLFVWGVWYECVVYEEQSIEWYILLVLVAIFVLFCFCIHCIFMCFLSLIYLFRYVSLIFVMVWTREDGTISIFICCMLRFALRWVVQVCIFLLWLIPAGKKIQLF